MSRQDQLKAMRLHRESLIEELEKIYIEYFDRLTKLDLSERDIAKLTQAMLHSRQEAIKMLDRSIEDPLIISAPKYND